MKRFGKILLDPTQVVAIAPLPDVGLSGVRYVILFFNGSCLSVDALDALLVIDHIVAPANLRDRPPQPDRTHA